MPARTVVLESLSKWSGEGHEVMQPGDYTQLTGRAGRRGIDPVGYGVVLHTPFVPFSQVTQVASAGSHPLRSSFRPTYNMAANLAANYPKDRAIELLSASFGQYQRQEDRSAAITKLAELEERLADEEAKASMRAGLGVRVSGIGQIGCASSARTSWWARCTRATSSTLRVDPVRAGT